MKGSVASRAIILHKDGKHFKGSFSRGWARFNGVYRKQGRQVLRSFLPSLIVPRITKVPSPCLNKSCVPSERAAARLGCRPLELCTCMLISMVTVVVICCHLATGKWERRSTLCLICLRTWRAFSSSSSCKAFWCRRYAAALPVDPLVELGVQRCCCLVVVVVMVVAASLVDCLSCYCSGRC